jgi:hypothetical protein
VGIVAGLVVGSIVAGAIAANGWPHRATVHSAPTGSVVDARAFLATWERSREGTWFVEARFERFKDGRRVLSTTLRIGQRPPDRLREGLGTIQAVRGGRRLACAPDAAAAVRCRDGGPAAPYRDEVRAELAVLRTYVVGPGRLYAVVAEPGTCFELRLRGGYLTPPYGQRARFCFDPATGAPIRSEINRLEATDRTVATAVRRRVTDADLDPVGRDGGGRG